MLNVTSKILRQWFHAASAQVLNIKPTSNFWLEIFWDSQVFCVARKLEMSSLKLSWSQNHFKVFWSQIIIKTCNCGNCCLSKFVSNFNLKKWLLTLLTKLSRMCNDVLPNYCSTSKFWGNILINIAPELLESGGQNRDITVVEENINK